MPAVQSHFHGDNHIWGFGYFKMASLSADLVRNNTGHPFMEQAYIFAFVTLDVEFCAEEPPFDGQRHKSGSHFYYCSWSKAETRKTSQNERGRPTAEMQSLSRRWGSAGMGESDAELGDKEWSMCEQGQHP